MFADPPPETDDLQALVRRIAERVGRMLERRGPMAQPARNASKVMRSANTGDGLPIRRENSALRGACGAPWPQRRR